MVSQQELKKALRLMNSDWKKQNNADDKQSSFIYTAATVDECLESARENGVDANYALHRWYNYNTSKNCEYIFIEYGARAEKNKTHTKIDIYIADESFDVKLSVYPMALIKSEPGYDLTKRSDKNKLIQWMYKNQSQEGRKHNANRLFLVCAADTAEQRMALKSEFDLIRQQIKAYMDYTAEHGFNRITIEDGGNEYSVLSDVIVIEQPHIEN